MFEKLQAKHQWCQITDQNNWLKTDKTAEKERSTWKGHKDEEKVRDKKGENVLLHNRFDTSKSFTGHSFSRKDTFRGKKIRI